MHHRCRFSIPGVSLGCVLAVASGPLQRANAADERVVYSFKGALDGDQPIGGLTLIRDKLYGVTRQGGASAGGTAFRLNLLGGELVLHSFGGSGDGTQPVAGLTQVGSVLFGTTSEGGTGCAAPGCGTVFSLTKAGAEQVIYSFTATTGSGPGSRLIAIGNPSRGQTLWGTASAGGVQGLGTEFVVSVSGTATVAHSFSGGTDGAMPVGDLLPFGGNQEFYGATAFGGGSGGVAGNGFGTIFGSSIFGYYSVLHAFNGTDGAFPNGGLSFLNNSVPFYGTTREGGAHGLGTIFTVSLDGTGFRTLYSFKGGADGATPNGNMLNYNGVLYGTTRNGGTAGAALDHTGGIVFSFDPKTKMETVLHAFPTDTAASRDGRNPSSGLLNVGGTLYGETAAGGKTGHGTVFAVTP